MNCMTRFNEVTGESVWEDPTERPSSAAADSEQAPVADGGDTTAAADGAEEAEWTVYTDEESGEPWW